MTRNASAVPFSRGSVVKREKQDLTNVPCRVFFPRLIIGWTAWIFKWKKQGHTSGQKSYLCKTSLHLNWLIESNRRFLFFLFYPSRDCAEQILAFSPLLYPLSLTMVLLIQFKTPRSPKGANKEWIFSASGRHLLVKSHSLSSSQQTKLRWAGKEAKGSLQRTKQHPAPALQDIKGTGQHKRQPSGWNLTVFLFVIQQRWKAYLVVSTWPQVIFPTSIAWETHDSSHLFFNHPAVNQLDMIKY